MMKLPSFTEPKPTSDWLTGEQRRLHNQADKMMATTGIMDIFSKYGEFSGVGGSYLYGTMIYPDLDIGVINQYVTRQTVADLLAELTLNNYVRGINTADTANFRLSKHSQKPKGFWIGVDIPFEDDRWGIDCWLQQPDWIEDSEDKYKARLAGMGDEDKTNILAIKYGLIYRGLYGKQYLSNDVYDAVLDKDIKSIDEFLSQG